MAWHFMSSTKTLAQVSSYVEPVLKQKVEALAKKERRSVSEIMSMILEEFFQDGGSLRRRVG
jgi:hypothetical protein